MKRNLESKYPAMSLTNPSHIYNQASAVKDPVVI